MFPEWDGIKLGNAAGPQCPDSGGKSESMGCWVSRGPLRIR